MILLYWCLYYTHIILTTYRYSPSIAATFEVCHPFRNRLVFKSLLLKQIKRVVQVSKFIEIHLKDLLKIKSLSPLWTLTLGKPLSVSSAGHLTAVLCNAWYIYETLYFCHSKRGQGNKKTTFFSLFFFLLMLDPPLDTSTKVKGLFHLHADAPWHIQLCNDGFSRRQQCAGRSIYGLNFSIIHYENKLTKNIRPTDI